MSNSRPQAQTRRFESLGTFIRGDALDTISDSLLTINACTPLSGHPDSVIHAGFAGQLQTLFSRSTTADDGLVAVEVLGDFFEGRVSGLDVKEIDDGEFNSEPDAVEDVVLPGEVIEGNWIDVLVEEDCDGS